MSDGKRHFIVGYFLCYSYKLILISPGIFHRALFEKWLTLVAEKSPESAKFTYSNLEAFNVHPPSYVILILKKMPFFIILLYPLPDKSPHLAAENLNVDLIPWGEGGGLKQAQKVNFGSVSDAFFCWFFPLPGPPCWPGHCFCFQMAPSTRPNIAKHILWWTHPSGESKGPQGAVWLFSKYA